MQRSEQSVDCAAQLHEHLHWHDDQRSDLVRALRWQEVLGKGASHRHGHDYDPNPRRRWEPHSRQRYSRQFNGLHVPHDSPLGFESDHVSDHSLESDDFAQFGARRVVRRGQ